MARPWTARGRGRVNFSTFNLPNGGFTVLAGPPGLPRREGAGEEPAEAFWAHGAER
jgi:hypothetical protein